MSLFTYIFESCPEISEKEVLRYAGIKGEISENIKREISDCVIEIKNAVKAKACYMKVPVEIRDKTVDFGIFKADSEKLALNLKNAKEAFLFAATLGIGVDRLINKYSLISPVKALYFQASGAAAIESVCDFFCENILLKLAGEEKSLRPRFSPGYGDLDISLQKEFINMLDCQRKIGLYLTEGGFMVPSKSVTAIAGITGKKENCGKGCVICENMDCIYRK